MTVNRAYWTFVFDQGTWSDFVRSNEKAGLLNPRKKIMGFPATTNLDKVRTGDQALCYIRSGKGTHRTPAGWVATVEVIGEPFESSEEVFRSAVYPKRLHVSLRAALPADELVEVAQMEGCLSYFDSAAVSAQTWGMHFRKPPVRELRSDFELVANEIHARLEARTIRQRNALRAAAWLLPAAGGLLVGALAVNLDRLIALLGSGGAVAMGGVITSLVAAAIWKAIEALLASANSAGLRNIEVLNNA